MERFWEFKMGGYEAAVGCDYRRELGIFGDILLYVKV